MAKKKVGVFVSFEFGKDNELHRGFYGQAKDRSCYDIEDFSLNEVYQPNEIWLTKARNQIRKSDIVVLVVRQDTHNAPGVLKEIAIATGMRKPRFQIKTHEGNYGPIPGAGDMIVWDWDDIDAKIDELMRASEVVNGVRVLK